MRSIKAFRDEYFDIESTVYFEKLVVYCFIISSRSKIFHSYNKDIIISGGERAVKFRHLYKKNNYMLSVMDFG